MRPDDYRVTGRNSGRRPVYCRPADRDNEAKVIAKLVAGLNKFNTGQKYTSRPAGKMDPFDAEIFCDGKLFAIAEVKGRTGPPRTDDWHFSNEKYERCQMEAARRKCKFFICFSWDDAAFVCDPNRVTRPGIPPFERAEGGRWDRNDPADVEIMIRIPAKHFHPI